MCMGWSMISVLWVALGGALGSVARYGISLMMGQWAAGHSWIGTLLVNILGCFLIALLMVVAQERYSESPFFTPLLMVGFCGGFTTFSTFTLDIYKLYTSGAVALAALYLFLSLALSALALLAGLCVGGRMIR